MWWFSESKEDVQWWLSQTTDHDLSNSNSVAAEVGIRRREKSTSGFVDGLKRLSLELTSPTNNGQQSTPRDVTSKEVSRKLSDKRSKNVKDLDKAPSPPPHSNGFEAELRLDDFFGGEDYEDEDGANSERLFFAIAKFKFTASQEDELSLREGQLIAVLETSTNGWWLGEEADKVKGRGSIKGGWFPASYVHAIREDESRQTQPKENALGDKKVPVALVAPYVSLVGPLESSNHPSDVQQLPTMDRLNMNFQSFPNDGRYDPVANSSWPRAGVRSGSLVTGLEPVIETVIARFAFQARGGQELSFAKGERLDILDRPEDDPEWLLASNCLGQKGLVPVNHLRDIDTSPGSSDLQLLNRASANQRNFAAARPDRADVPFLYQDQPWFFGPIARAYADVLLNAFGSVGDFLVRSSETSVGDLSLTVRGPGCNRHFQISVDDAESFRIGQRKFFNLSDLVEYYKRVPIYTTQEGYRLYLVKPFKKP